MARNLDMTALRSFVTVAETGGVTRAAGFLNLTQSAVSMQLKRLEEALDLQLLDRSARAISLTAAGEQLQIKRLFQPFQLHRHRRLRQVQETGRPRHAACFRHGDKRAKRGHVEISCHITDPDE